MTGNRRRVLLAATAAVASVLAGCASSETAAERTIPPPPVVVTQAAPQVVVAPAAPQMVVAPPAQRVVSYPEGRYQLYGDAFTGYYWVWIPAGTAVPAPPVPPALPRVSEGRLAAAAPVVVARPERVVTYAEGRYELYGDPARGYYWVWIPAGFIPPAPPPHLRVSQGP